MKNFRDWYDNADIPVKRDGVWVDDETGLAYNNPTTTKTSISTAAKNARAKSSYHGAKALKGTTKQKEWAEKIRAEMFDKIGDTEAKKFADLKSDVLLSASFWINNRNKVFSVQDALDAIRELRILYDKHYDVLARTAPVHLKDAAKKDIIDFYRKTKVILDVDFPSFDLKTILSKI